MYFRISSTAFFALALLSAVSVSAQRPASPRRTTVAADPRPSSFSSISRAEVELLLAEVAASNPDVVKRFAADPGMKKTQLDNLKQLLGFASEAERTGIAAEPVKRHELQNIRDEVTAVNYDHQFNKAQTVPFASVSGDRVAKFWTIDTARREAEFKTFLDTKLELLNATDRPIPDEEKAQAREFFAKVQILDKDYRDKVAAGTISKRLQDTIALQIRLQQAQFLAKAISERLDTQVAVTDQDVAAYISSHPEFDLESKRAKAESILKRARAGEDFAMLADQFSDDPGDRGENGKSNGGLYKNVPKGMMIPAFEQSALSLKPGEVADKLVETVFGYHIIKLEKPLGTGAAATYDVRHILVSTTVKDPENPAAREMPVTAFVRSRLENEKKTRLTNEIVARNHISVPADFTVPTGAVSTTVKPSSPAATKKTEPVKKTAPAARRRRT